MFLTMTRAKIALIKTVVSTLLALLIPSAGLAQVHSGFPVDIVAGSSPQPFAANGKTHLLYELRITNFSSKQIDLKGLDVTADRETSPLESYREDALEKLLVPVGSDDSPSKASAIGGGRSLVIFLDLLLKRDALAPTKLRHRLTLSVALKEGAAIERVVDGPTVAVSQAPALVLRAPLKGSGWVAANALSSADHRRSLVAVDGRVRIAQRFAIDWVQQGPDGRLFRGDSNSNANFYGYGAEVIAAADGEVSDLRDGQSENAGSNVRENRAITLENIAGNYVILDLGQGHFALYAHLQPGSLKVKLGDTVKAGATLALLGNSGNSDAPHLHFQLMDSNSPLGAEGIPYELETFTQLGIVTVPDSLDAGQPWKPDSQGEPVVHKHEFPIDYAVVAFP